MSGESVTLSLCGDVMPGRGVDQILPHPGAPELREGFMRDARSYVELAERVNGSIPAPVDFSWPWGEALDVLEEAAPDVRVINLETSVTRHGDFDRFKGVHYRMNPANLGCLTAARPDVCVLANNHVLDFGRSGLEETLDSLAGAGLRTAGAGRDTAGAREPAVVPLDGGRRRVIVLAMGTPSSGIPMDWAALPNRSGVNLLDLTTRNAAALISGSMRESRRPGDIVVVSVHWGSNWGYDLPRNQTVFARALIDGGGVDIVHGHSSHHPRPIEVYRGKLVLYGCGDFIDDYEGVEGHEEYRDDLRLLYLASVEADTGRLTELRMAPFQARRMRLSRAAPEDAEWLRAVLDRVSGQFGVRVGNGRDGMLTLQQAGGS
ncbi:CapA family protein [Streptomyces sp. WMMB 322]|uniref:CapA family protein n=1 Tax=Streptomyces sp. WMMB 322 TaxID=1286821 RepID=UPI0006E17430|nr:CapA family protein [Streptomyces sp. WMMB 322]SCK36174.1 poly-gamma-glutamate synthesis protein (capsule biosynthesis protein) [Streptomyces sp. WMMB 322]